MAVAVEFISRALCRPLPEDVQTAEPITDAYKSTGCIRNRVLVRAGTVRSAGFIDAYRINKADKGPLLAFPEVSIRYITSKYTVFLDGSAMTPTLAGCSRQLLSVISKRASITYAHQRRVGSISSLSNVLFGGTF